MTPDEVVKGLQELNIVMENVYWKGQKEHPEKSIFISALSSAISLISDYQKLRERVSVEKLVEMLMGYQGGCELHIATQPGFNKLSQSIVTYLQQPTEH